MLNVHFMFSLINRVHVVTNNDDCSDRVCIVASSYTCHILYHTVSYETFPAAYSR